MTKGIVYISQFVRIILYSTGRASAGMG